MHRRAFWLVMLAAFLPLPALGQSTDESAVPRVSVADLKKAADAGQVLIIDVRDATWYAEGHLPGAINIPLAELEQKLAMVKAAKKPLVAYCA
jgi:ArsR family transcriptional regulator